MLKIIIPLTLIKSSYTRSNENKLNKTDDSNMDNGKINNKIANLSKSTKKISFRVGFLAFKASLTFIQLRKRFTKALILYYIDLEYYIQSEINVLSYTIDEVLN